MNDNVVEFPGKEGEKKKRLSADDALKGCMGKLDEVIIIGIGPERTQLISTVGGPESVYELSRALHILHDCLESM